MRFFKLAVIVLLKICATEKIFGKICLKVIRDTFFSNMWSAISGVTGRLKVLVEGDIQQKGKLQTYGLAGRPPHTQFPPVVGHPDLPIRKTLRRVLVCLLQWSWKERERVFTFKATNLQHVRLKMKKRSKILWWHSIYRRLSIHFKVRSI